MGDLLAEDAGDLVDLLVDEVGHVERMFCYGVGD